MANHHVRADRTGQTRTAFEKNRKKILLTQDVCAICGRPVDKTLKYPDPYSATVDHIIPINRGGHPSDINNLQLAHAICNRQKSDNLMIVGNLLSSEDNKAISPDDLPLHFDWANYRGDTHRSGGQPGGSP